MNEPYNRGNQHNLIVVIFIDLIIGLVSVINENIYIIESQLLAIIQWNDAARLPYQGFKK